jgi:hypothetical protein
MIEEQIQELELIEHEIAEYAKPLLVNAPELNSAIDKLMHFCGKLRAE